MTPCWTPRFKHGLRRAPSSYALHVEHHRRVHTTQMCSAPNPGQAIRHHPFARRVGMKSAVDIHATVADGLLSYVKRPYVRLMRSSNCCRLAYSLSGEHPMYQASGLLRFLTHQPSIK